jgi:hypothetical protein
MAVFLLTAVRTSNPTCIRLVARSFLYKNAHVRKQYCADVHVVINGIKRRLTCIECVFTFNYSTVIMVMGMMSVAELIPTLRVDSPQATETWTWCTDLLNPRMPLSRRSRRYRTFHKQWYIPVSLLLNCELHSGNPKLQCNSTGKRKLCIIIVIQRAIWAKPFLCFFSSTSIAVVTMRSDFDVLLQPKDAGRTEDTKPLLWCLKGELAVLVHRLRNWHISFELYLMALSIVKMKSIEWQDGYE